MTIDAPQPAQVPALRKLWTQAFGDTEAFLDGFFSTGFSPARCRCVTLQDRTVAALYWFDCLWQEKKLAYIYAVATDEAYRGQGLCRALMEAAHTHLQAVGYTGALLVPGSADLFALYQKLGYVPFCPMTRHTVTAGAVPVRIHPVSPEEYARLRKEALPPDSVLQEGSTLAFLQTFAGFYAGDDTLFCAARDADTLYFQEYLGDPALVPGILTALETEKASLRLPGGNTPYAMYRSLVGDPHGPQYLGLPLD